MDIASSLHEIATNTAFLKEITKSLQIITTPKQEISFSLLLVQIIASFFAILTALLVAYLMPHFVKKFQKPNLMPLKILRVFQSVQYYYRLAIKNDSDFIAKNVEIDIEEVVDDNGASRLNLIPAPLRWTHRNTASRDIFPHQIAYVDLLEAKQEATKFLHILAPNIESFSDMVVLRQGTTRLKLKYYNENGQAKDIKIKVIWNGQEKFNDNDLPVVRIEK